MPGQNKVIKPEWADAWWVHEFVFRMIPDGCHSVFEVGVGNGALLRKLSAFVNVADGVDSDPIAVAEARSAIGPEVMGRVEVARAEEVDRVFAGAEYEFVVCARSLHHADIERAIPAVARLVRPGGRLLIVDLFLDRSRSVYSFLLLHRVLGTLAQPRQIGTWLRCSGLRSLLLYKASILKLCVQRHARQHIADDLRRCLPFRLSQWRHAVSELDGVNEHLLPGALIAFVWDRPVTHHP